MLNKLRNAIRKWLGLDQLSTQQQVADATVVVLNQVTGVGSSVMALSVRQDEICGVISNLLKQMQNAHVLDKPHSASVTSYTSYDWETVQRMAAAELEKLQEN
jgi:hypothetical protein